MFCFHSNTRKIRHKLPLFGKHPIAKLTAIFVPTMCCQRACLYRRDRRLVFCSPAWAVARLGGCQQKWRSWLPQCLACCDPLQREHWRGGGHNERCQNNIAKKNVSAAKNGFDLIRVAIRASAIAPKSAAKRSGKPSRKGVGWQKIQDIGAAQKTWKKLSSGV